MLPGNLPIRFQWLGGICSLALALLPTPSLAVDLFSEDFNDLTLGPVVTFASEIRSRAAWTEVPPTGWTNDDSGVPTDGNANSGADEFEGWSFVDKDWWIATAGNQDRGLFSNASGIIAVADPDEWDDFGFPAPSSLGSFDAKLTSPSIALGGVGVNQAKVFLHSSWRPEDNQKASLTAKYNNGANVEIFRWESKEKIDDGLGGEIPNPKFKDDAPNEGLTFDLANPAGASSVQLEFRVFDASNDWWWAFDNLQVFTGTAPSADGVLRAIIDRTTSSVKIVNNTGAAVDLRGYSLRSSAGAFEEADAAFLSDNDPNWLQATRLGDPANDLSEIHLTSGTLANQAQINFGNVWRKFHRDSSDVHFEYLVEGSDEPVQGILEFTGNGDESFEFLDLNYNGDVEIGDWLKFKQGFGVSLTGQPEVVRHNLGDLDNDKLHSLNDFLEFEARFNAINGAGSFAAALAGVPEPSSFLLFCMAAVFGSLRRVRFTLSAWRLVAFIGCLASIAFTSNDAHAQLQVYFEDFESLSLGPNVQEVLDGDNVWTNTPPTGWTANNAGIPGIGNVATNGVDEWAGWSFASKDWWVEAAGDQDRGQFSRGQGTVMIADADEWDDDSGQENTDRRALATAPTPDNMFDTFITTKTISIPAGIPAGRIKLAFDSSWRPEGMDDLDLSNNQTATINVRYNGGPKTEVLRWDSDPEGDNFHDDATNERVANLDLQYNGTATTMQLEFGLSKAWNDWWWAVDNISIEVPANPSVVKIDTNTGRGYLVGGDVISTTIKSIDIGSIGGQLSGATTTGLSSAGGMEKMDGSDPGAVAGDSLGEQWELLTASDSRIAEAFLFGHSVFDSNRSVDLGVIFDPSTPAASRDVTFNYTTLAGDLVTGAVQYFTAPGVPGDYNGNGTVDAADYTSWGDALGSSVTLPNDSTPGSVTQADYNVWRTNFGQSIGPGGGGSALSAVPETASASLLLEAIGLSAAFARRTRYSALVIAITFVATIVTAASSTHAFTLDRDYRFGNSDPGAANGGNVGVTFDNAGQLGMHQLTDLAAVGGLGAPPKYVTINDRPDGVSGLGIRLNQVGVEKQYLKTGFGEALNAPELSPASTHTPGGTIDYSFITDRGFQLWAKPSALPTASTRFDIVMDSNQHGVSINSAGKFVMRYAYEDYPSTISATANSWYHLSVVRPFGPGNGSILYVNGQAVAAATGLYNTERILLDDQGEETNLDELDTSPLIVGANTGIGPTDPASDPRPQTPSPGTTNYFRGIVDDLEMFVMGMNAENDFGEYVFQNDNDYAAFFKPTNPVDMTGEGLLTFADAQSFASNWLFERKLEWTDVLGDEHTVIVGDLTSRSKGDFNFDGRTDLADWAMLNSASPGVGAAAMTLIQGGSVPEPSTAVLVGLTSMGIAMCRSRRKYAASQQDCALDSRRPRRAFV